MYYRDGRLPPSPDTILSGSEIVDISEGLIWPIADRVWGDDFSTMGLGEHTQRSQTIITSEGLRRGVIIVECMSGAEDEDDADETSEFEVVRSVFVRYEVPGYGMTDTVFEDALKDQHDEDSRQELELKRGYLQAWGVHLYQFDPQADAGLADIDHRLELQDDFAEVYWDSRAPIIGSTGSEPQSDNVITVINADEALPNDGGHMLTYGDRENIFAALGALKLVKTIYISPDGLTWE